MRWGLFAVARDPVSLLAIQLTHAFTFGVFYLAGVQTMDTFVPDGLRATAQGIFASVTFGLGGLVGNALAGLLYEPLGMDRLYMVAAVLAAGATVLYWAETRTAMALDRGASAHDPGGRPR
jgi:PPP family 3-phenylpropionic acid transporter